MTAGTYTVTAAKNAGEKENPHGGTLVKWYLTVTDEQGNATEDVYCQKKPENALGPGDTVYGRLEQGEYGWRLYPEQNPNGASGGGGSQTKDDYWRAKDQRDIEGIVRMGRAHAQEMALRYIELLPANAEVRNPARLPDTIKHWTDFFEADVNAKSAGTGGGGSTVPSGTVPPIRSNPPAAAGSSAPGFRVKPDGTSPQKDYFETLLKKTPATPDTVNAIMAYAETLPNVSSLIDLLKEGPTANITARQLAGEAQEWAANQPAAGEPDTRDLPEPEGAVVIPDDDGIPF